MPRAAASSWQEGFALLTPDVGTSVEILRFAQDDLKKDALRATGLNPHRLKVELTVGTAMEDPERAVDLMLQLGPAAIEARVLELAGKARAMLCGLGAEVNAQVYPKAPAKHWLERRKKEPSE